MLHFNCIQYHELVSSYIIPARGYFAPRLLLLLVTRAHTDVIVMSTVRFTMFELTSSLFDDGLDSRDKLIALV